MATDQTISEVFKLNKDLFTDLSKEIWKNPESGFQEFKAHDLLCQTLRENGFQVEASYKLPTGFRATFGSTGPHVCFICEYDAVPGVGHGSGHNLVAIANLAAGFAIKKCIEDKQLVGKVTILGTPAEDCCGGTKIAWLSEHVFDDIDFCLVAYPWVTNMVYPKSFARLTVTVRYTGRAAHATVYPWEGKNALDAAVACYNNIALLKQQLKSTWHVNGIITQGGLQPNVIPENTELVFWIRAPEHPDLVLVEQKCNACFKSAAQATGCDVDVHYSEMTYYSMRHNRPLGEIFERQARSLGIDVRDTAPDDLTHRGSTDMGNVSRKVPCLNPAFSVGANVPLNSAQFHQAAGTTAAESSALNTAKALALTAAEVMSNANLLETVKAELQ